MIVEPDEALMRRESAQRRKRKKKDRSDLGRSEQHCIKFSSGCQRCPRSNSPCSGCADKPACSLCECMETPQRQHHGAPLREQDIAGHTIKTYTLMGLRTRSGLRNTTNISSPCRRDCLLTKHYSGIRGKFANSSPSNICET